MRSRLTFAVGKVVGEGKIVRQEQGLGCPVVASDCPWKLKMFKRTMPEMKKVVKGEVPLQSFSLRLS